MHPRSMYPSCYRLQRQRHGAVPRVFVAIVSIPLLLILAVAAWWMGRNAAAQREVDRKLAQLREQRLPVDQQSLLDYYRRLTSPERFASWLSVFEELKTPDSVNDARQLPVVGSPPPDVDEVPLPGQPYPLKNKVEAFLQKQQPLLGRIHELAADAGPVSFSLELDSYNTLLPWVQSIRNVANLLTLQHDHAVYKGDASTATRAIVSLLGVGRTLEGDPILVSQLVRVAIHHVAIDSLKRSLESDLLSDQQLRQIRAELVAYSDHRPVLPRALAGERAFVMAMHRDPEGLPQLPPLATFSRPRDMLATLRLFEKSEAVARRDLDGLMAGSVQLKVDFTRTVHSTNWLEQFDTVLTGQLVPAIDSVHQAFVAQVMRNRIAELAIALRLFQHQIGDWPQRLSELQRIGVDPGQLMPPGGKPFGYRPAQDRALLWGFRPDLDVWRQEGGQAASDEPPEPDPAGQNQGSADDWLWELESTTRQDATSGIQTQFSVLASS